MAGAVAVGGAVIGLVRYRRLRRYATTDDLTGLPNRHAFERRAAALLRGGDGSCLVLVDLDGFKAINDGAGHAAGDRVLVAVADRLRRSVRRDDLVARWGGDEFVVLLVGIGDRDAGARRAATLLADLGRGIGEAGTLTASFGVAVAPTDGTQLGELLAVADTAMYAAKPARTPSGGLARPSVDGVLSQGGEQEFTYMN